MTSISDDHEIEISRCSPDELGALHMLIECSYRGDNARLGWTHEADLLDGTRTSLATLEDIMADPTAAVLVARRGEGLLGSVQVSDMGDGIAYLSMLCVDPVQQAGGLGKRLIATAEAHAGSTFSAKIMEMSVLPQRTELIAYYQRRGYVLTGERRPFPVELDPPFELVVLAKTLVTTA